MNTEPLFSGDHPGGNIVIERLAPGRAWLAPDFRHMQEGYRWFYWSFRAKNRVAMRVTFSHRNYLGARGPAISKDGGRTWNWLGRDSVMEEKCAGSDGTDAFTFEIPPVTENEEVYYAFCPQYQEWQLQEWLIPYRDHPALHVFELCKSRRGRSVEQLEIMEPGAPTTREILFLTARHHSCESMASYVLEGFLDAALGNDEVGRGLRAGWKIVAIPFVDKDGVEEGDQGKLRHPHDHNRDYQKSPIYPEVDAIMRFGKENQKAIVAYFDLHCPMVHGSWDNRFYLVGSSIPGNAARQNVYAEILGKTQTGPIRPFAQGVLQFGEAWNTGSNYSAGTAAATWAAQSLRETALATTFEIPYANAEGVEVNPQSARLLGRDLAVALLAYSLSRK